uniref:Uncharacterized protein n=1 Tax=Tanacetum cinerariifolium TaxID=118510 RepID=A0A699IDQ2_TANCI|nr:hypothetical protein [Tanacetum cinerariifolium]
MADAQQTNVLTTQVTEDTHVIITSVNPEGQQPSSSVSSRFILNMFNPSPDTCIDSIFNPNTKSTSQVDVRVTTAAEPPLLSATTLPPPSTPIITHLQQTPVPSPSNVPSSSMQDLPNFGSLFGFDQRQKALEDNFSKFMQTNQFAKAISSIPGIIDKYLKNRMNEAVKVAVQLQSDRLRDEAQAKNKDFLNKIDENIKKIIKDESKTSHAIAANLSELELKKILIDNMEGNKTIYRSTEQKNLHKALVEAYESNKLILDTYGDTRKRDGKEPESTSAPKEKTSMSTGKSTEGSKSHHKSAPAEEPMHTAEDLEEPTHQDFITVQPWISNLAQKDNSRDSFNELMDTPLDFSAFMMNQLTVDTLTLELLTGPTFKPMKGSCKSLVELEYFFEEVYMATTDQLDWNNPEGQQYPHDLRKPLPLIPNSRGRRVIPFDHFINNDLEYLSGGVSSRKYTTSVAKTKAADYGNIKWIEDLVPNRMESARDVYSKRRIIAVTELQIVEWNNYKHLDWITESYQKKINLTKPDTYQSDLKRKEAYTTYSNPRGFIYQNKDTKNRLMRIDELHKFSDGTLNDVRSALDDHLKGIRMQYLPQTIWRRSDKDKAGAMI